MHTQMSVIHVRSISAIEVQSALGLGAVDRKFNERGTI